MRRADRREPAAAVGREVDGAGGPCAEIAVDTSA
jgi:hypothetical protein